MCRHSPEFGNSNGSFFNGSGDLGDCINCPSKGKPIERYWSADIHKSTAYDTDSSPTMSLTMEPLIGQVSDSSPLRPWESGHYVSYKDRDGGYYYENSPSPKLIDHYMIGGASEPMRESWGSRSLRQALGELEEPLGISDTLSSPLQEYAEPYLESNQGSVLGKNVTEGYYDMMGSLRKIMPGNHSVCINMESGGSVFVGQDESDSEEEEDLFIERQAMGWSTNHSTKSNLSLSQGQSSPQDAYADFHYTMPMTDVEDAWPENHSLPYHLSKTIKYLEGRAKSNTCPVHGRQASVSSADCSSYIHLCHKPREAEVYPVPCCQALSNSHFVDPLTGSLVRNSFMNDKISDKNTDIPNRNPQVGQAALPTEHFISKPETAKPNIKQTEHPEYVDTCVRKGIYRQDRIEQQDTSQDEMETEVITITDVDKPLSEISKEPESDRSRMVDSGVEHGHSSTSLVESDNCSDDDITDVTSGIFGDFPGDFAETVDYTSPSFKSLQKQVGTPDSIDSIDLPSTAGYNSETLSPTSLHPSTSPRTVDSGYDTENNESPEFVLKEPHEPQDTKNYIQPLGLSVADSSPIVEAKEDVADTTHEYVEAEVGIKTSQSNEMLTVLTEKTPYRDSAYFSDTDAGKEKDWDKDRNKDIDEIEMKEESTIDLKTLPTPVVEQEKSNNLETEENTENFFIDIQEGTQTPLPTEEEEKVFTEPTIISSDIHDCCINNNVKDEAFHMNSNDSQEMPSEDLLSDSTALPFSKTNHETEQTDPILSLESSVAESVVKDNNVETSLDSFVNNNEVKKELVTEETTFSTSSEKLSTQLNIDVKISDSAKSVLTDNMIDKLETLDGTSKIGVQFYKSSIRPFSPPPPLPLLEGQVSPVERGDADDGDRDSEDSDESDEELRTYSIQEQSEESEDEDIPVPIIVSDCSDAHKLRSILKMSSLSDDNPGDESKKKVVSFFDDVTVYLFDQESPTGELTEHAYPLGCKTSTQGAKCTLSAVQQEKANSTDDSDGNVSEESTGLEWDDDFALPPLPTSSKDSPPDIKAKPSFPPSSTNDKPVVQFSRFSVSPSPISRFSITHVSDSDMDSAGGSSEDGDRE
ncbi:Serine/threonine-protein kinase LMTK1 [Bagarius yarrelli]|uniref:Serine/threonine-protein kinase LMTK1 n=1 Tax=Bagarius yarrelli TaxID=175774 RepID=A0A556TJH3_BAGYA|nr:Serine/threonine-protein kinase LMTK1 [Bagarius yarrelli]